jgi:phosphatidylglycerol:prolipoprotein diacylglycerol transferase
MCRVAFHFGNLTIYWYGIFVALGMIAGLWTASRFSAGKGISPETVIDSGIWLVLGGIIGARLYYVVSNWGSIFANQPLYEIFMIQKGGLVYYGGLVGGLAGAYLFARSKKLAFLKLYDVLAVGLPVGHFFGRIGCFMNGCCYGKPTNLPWAIHFPASHETGGVGVHPTELYEAGLNILLFFWLANYFRKTKIDGLVTSCYLMSYAILRFCVEFYRGDYPQSQMIFNGIFTPAQGLSIVIFITGLALHIGVKAKSKSSN